MSQSSRHQHGCSQLVLSALSKLKKNKVAPRTESFRKICTAALCCLRIRAHAVLYEYKEVREVINPDFRKTDASGGRGRALRKGT